MTDRDIEAAPAPDDAGLRRVSELTARLLDLRAKAETAALVAKAAAEAVRQAEEVDLPQAMLDVGLTEFTTADGASVTLRTSYHASIPRARQGEAFAWLEANGHGAIVKHDVGAQFGRGDGDRAASAARLLSEAFPGTKVTDREHVNAQTLSALVREQVAAGVDLPFDLLGVYVRRAVEVKLPE